MQISCNYVMRLKSQEQIVLRNCLNKAYSPRCCRDFLGNAKSLVGECKMENHGGFVSESC